MAIKIGEVEAIFRYPVKSMSGERLEVAELGWHGLDGDRRLAFRRMDDRSGFPWLSASRLPELLLYAPQRRDDATDADLPTMFVRRMARNCLCSVRSWPRRSDAGTAHFCR